MKKGIQSRWAWAITGSGHFLPETLGLIAELGSRENVDLFLSRAGAEVLKMYHLTLPTSESVKVFHDKTASAAPIGGFYYGQYHTVVIAPATSNCVAKFVHGISDDLVSNFFAHAGKTCVRIIVFACDTSPEILSIAPKGPVMVYPRPIDLENFNKLQCMPGLHVAASFEDLNRLIIERKIELHK